MRFVTLPKNGSSWQDPLCYTLDTGDTTPQDVEVEILDMMSGEVIGSKRLYGVITFEIDIAPYVRNAIATGPPSSAQLSISPSARSVAIRVGALLSATRVFFRTTLDCSKSHLLTSDLQPSEVTNGDVIRFTVMVLDELKIRVVDKRITISPPIRAIVSHGMPVEIAIPTASYSGSRVPIAVEIFCENRLLASFDYTIVEREQEVCNLVWYNKLGGVESYTFPTVVRNKYVSKEISAGGRTQLSTAVRYRLMSAFELQAQLERIAEVVLSQEVYECRDGECRELRLLDREIAFDEHGKLRRLVLNVEKIWV